MDSVCTQAVPFHRDIANNIEERSDALKAFHLSKRNC